MYGTIDIVCTLYGHCMGYITWLSYKQMYLYVMCDIYVNWNWALEEENGAIIVNQSEWLLVCVMHGKMCVTCHETIWTTLMTNTNLDLFEEWICIGVMELL